MLVKIQNAIIIVCAFTIFIHFAEPERMKFADGFASQVPRACIVTAKHCCILCGLKFKDARFGGCVSLHAAMPVQMIGCEIQDSSHIGRNDHLFQLEAGYFKNGKVARLHFIHVIDQRIADVASNVGMLAIGLFCHLPYQRGGGGFACRTGDADRLTRYGFHKNLRVVGKRHVALQG